MAIYTIEWLWLYILLSDYGYIYYWVIMAIYTIEYYGYILVSDYGYIY